MIGRGAAILGSVVWAGAWTAGCAPGASEPADAGAVRSSSAGGGVELVLSADRASIATTDRLGVTLEIIAAPGVRTRIAGPAFEPAGWTVVASDIGGPRLDADGRVLVRHGYVLEPFLPGTYAVPGPEVEWARDDGAGGIASVPELRIDVASVLDADASPELAAARPMLDPADLDRADGPSSLDLALVLGGGAAVVLVGAWLVLRRRPADAGAAPSALDEIRAVASGGTPDALARLDRALHRAIETGASKTEVIQAGAAPAAPRTVEQGLRASAARVERWRFGGRPVSERAVRDEARAIIELIGGPR